MDTSREVNLSQFESEALMKEVIVYVNNGELNEGELEDVDGKMRLN